MSTGVYSCDPDIEEKQLGFNDKFASKKLPFSAERAAYSGKFQANGKYEEEISSEKPEQKGDFICTVKRVKVAAEYNENIVLDPTTDIFYVGSMLQGDSIETGAYTPIGTNNRSPITISISLENIQGEVFREVKRPANSSVRQAIRDMLSQELTGATPARVSFEQTEVRTEEELGIAVGAGYSYNAGVTKLDLAASFNFDKTDQTSRTVIKYVQVYYTLDLDLDKSGPKDWFVNTDEVDINSFKGMPVYISSVKYGRMILFTIESKASTQEVKAAFDLAFSGVVHSANLSASTTYRKVNDNSSIKATVIGGSGVEAAKTLTKGLEGVYNYVNTGGNYSKSSPAAPLGYTMRSLYNNEVVKSILASEYNIRNCQQNTGRYKLHFDKIKHIHFEGDDGSQYEVEAILTAKVITPLAENPKGHNSKTPLIVVEDTHNFVADDKFKRISVKTAYNSYKIGKSTPALAFKKSDIEALVDLDLVLFDHEGGGAHQRVDGSSSVRINLKGLQPTRENILRIQNSQGFGELVYRLEVLPAK